MKSGEVMSVLPFEDIEYICKLMFSLFEVPIYFIKPDGEIICEFSDTELELAYSSRKDRLLQVMNEDDPSDFPIIRTLQNVENFLLIKLSEGYLIAGPSVEKEISENNLICLMNDFHMFKDKQAIIRYYQSLKKMKKSKLIHASIYIYYVFFQKKLDYDTVVQQNRLLQKSDISPDSPELTLSLKRQNITFHADPMYERKIFQSVREGNKGELIKYLSVLPEDGDLGTLSKTSYIRSQKNLSISGITLATRAAMEGGVHPEIAYTLSDLFIQKLEELYDLNEIKHLSDEALCEFADRVQMIREQQYSKAIKACQHYIFKHLYNELSLSTLSSIAGLNSSYLSVLFKKEVGTSLSEYIQRARVEEAKNLLRLTNYSLTDICTLLNFSDQSYFTKVFRKFTGFTPRQFKNTN
jgi:YesN/AraC family two-component response regulator